MDFLDRIIAFYIVIYQISGRASVYFLSRMGNDRTAKLSLKLTNRVAVRKIEIDTEAQNPDFELNVLLDTEITDDELNWDALNAHKILDFTMSTKNAKVIYLK